jgi:hypothetical protein
MLTQNCKKNRRQSLNVSSAVSKKTEAPSTRNENSCALRNLSKLRTPAAGGVSLCPTQSVLYFQAAISDTTTVAVPSGNNKLNTYYYILFR